MNETAANSTMLKFGHPDTVIAETEHWSVQLRPQQVTLGSLVLVCREPVTAFGEVSAEGFADLKPLTARIEALLSGFVEFQRINYLMLMMVDRDVHFHVIPRYEGVCAWEGLSFPDAGWPGTPRLDQAVSLDAAQMARLAGVLRHRWPAG